MKLDNNAIETISISAVKNAIATSEYLAPFISDNDKEPSWDGFVYIYSNTNKKKENFKGRMPVQVKGKVCEDFSKERISYPMSVVDLKNYLCSGGVVLFVVYISKSGTKSKVYSTALTPLKLRELLKKVTHQKTKSVELSEFPNESREKASFFLNSFESCQKQYSFNDTKLFTYEEIKKQGDLKEIVIPFSGYDESDMYKELFSNDIYAYANLEGSKVLHPLEGPLKDICIKEEIKINVSVENKIFYDVVELVRTKRDSYFLIGDSFRILMDNKDLYKIKYQSSSRLRSFRYDLEFLLAIQKAEYFKLGDEKIDINNEKIFALSLVEEEKQLIFAKKAIQALEILNCYDDLLLDSLTDKDWNNLKMLITAFVDQKPIKGLAVDVLPIHLINIREYTFMLYFKKQMELEEDSHLVFDYFNIEMDVKYDDEKGMKQKMSQFVILEEDELINVKNIKFEKLLPSFQNIKDNDEIIIHANIFLLKLLSAYDKSDKERKDILDTAKSFAEWIFTFADDAEIIYEFRLINYYQTIKRERPLTIVEEEQLYKLMKDSKVSNESLVGIHLLLDQQNPANIYFEELSKEQQEEFKSYPIYHFWKNTEEDND